MYKTGSNFTFIALGDPQASMWLDDAGTQFNGYYIHVIGLPNDPVIPKL